MKVLVIGWEVSDFMCPLFSTLRKEYATQVDLFELRPKEQMKKEAYTSFDNVLDISLKINDYSKAHILSSLLSGYFVKKLFSGTGLKSAIRYAVLHKKLAPVISGYDIVHICYVTKNIFGFFDAITEAKKLVVTMWGSDILHNNVSYDYSDHAPLMKIADAVTVHQREMKELFLSKFGREYAGKVHEMLVVSDTSYLDKFILAIPDKDVHIKNFKERHNISNEKRLVVVGHSAHPIDMHLDIIKVIGALESNIATRICLVFPLTYGCDIEGYFEMIANACDEIGVEYVLLTQFLSDEHVLELRVASEILIRLSLMDAFSLSLCETLCAGNVLITGTWLPYGKLRGNNVYYEEVYDMNDAGGKLEHVLNNYDQHESRCNNNPEHIKSIFAKENSAKKLHDIYTNVQKQK